MAERRGDSCGHGARKRITPDTVATLDADGTLHVFITPEITGTKEAVDAIRPLVDEVDQLGVTTAGLAIGLLPTTTMDQVEWHPRPAGILQQDEGLGRLGQILGWLRRRTTDLSQIESVLKLNFDAESVAQLSAYVGELVAAIQQGGEISEEDLPTCRPSLTCSMASIPTASARMSRRVLRRA